MNIHTMLKQKKKRNREAAVRTTASTEEDNNREQQRPHVIHNLCPRCGYNMGTYWSSQYCSRRCLYGNDDDDDDDFSD